MKALRVRKVALCALFICIAAVLSAVESFLPPICAIPGVRVGLGNIVTMFMLYIGGKWRSIDVMLVVILRCFVAAFITGQVMNLFYGVMGGICALGIMLLMRKLLPGENRENWLPLVGIMGALAHIAGQIIVHALHGGFDALHIGHNILSKTPAGPGAGFGSRFAHRAAERRQAHTQYSIA